MFRKQKQKQKGFTLVEMVVGLAIMGILIVGVVNTYGLLSTSLRVYREKTATSALADYYLELARNLPYSQIGTVSGNPHGNLADQPNPISTAANGNNYQIYYSVTYIDDPADGTILAGTDPAPSDYKQVKVYIKNTATNSTSTFQTVVAPQGLESLASGGALAIKVFDSVGQPVSGASIHITNPSINPIIDVTRTSDAGGNWIEVGLPNSVNGYHITVTKGGYSSDQTYPISAQNPNPIKPDATISNGQVTQISFSIDLTSTLTFQTLNQTCAAIPTVGVEVQGAKQIGTDPNVLKFDNTYTSNGSGQINLGNLEWDTYTPSLTAGTDMIYGSSPIQQISVLPNTTQTYNLILGPATANSLLVIVKDAATGTALEGASVELSSLNNSFDQTKTTGGSIWTQNDWTGGSGQADFTDAAKYQADDGNIDVTAIPTGIRLSQTAGNYAVTGLLESSAFDSGSTTASYSTLTWQPTSQNPATSLKFQIATNNDDLTWNYLGPDGTANTYYTTPGTSIAAANNTGRYIRYKAFLASGDPAQTPVLSNIAINYISGCHTPGQAMFAGLNPGTDYALNVSLTSYITQNITAMSVSGYNVIQVLLSH